MINTQQPGQQIGDRSQKSKHFNYISNVYSLSLMRMYQNNTFNSPYCPSCTNRVTGSVLLTTYLQTLITTIKTKIRQYLSFI